jgi:hypothetical protein
MGTPAGKKAVTERAGKKSGRLAAKALRLAQERMRALPAFIYKVLFLRSYLELTTATICVHGLNAMA